MSCTSAFSLKTLICHCRDYEVLPELDRYEESELAPNTDFGVMSYEDRMRAEEAMNRRDGLENMHGRIGEFLKLKHYRPNLAWFDRGKSQRRDC